MLVALTRDVSPAIVNCELEFLDRQPIDVALAREQHRQYRECLAELGAQVELLPATPDLPDGVFVEDPAIVLDEIAVITRMGAVSRRGEHESWRARSRRTGNCSRSRILGHSKAAT